jgi:hypothetical protein
MKVSLTRGDEIPAWREGANDDLVLALATGLWIAEKEPDYPFACSYGRSMFGDDGRDQKEDWGFL